MPMVIPGWRPRFMHDYYVRGAASGRDPARPWAIARLTAIAARSRRSSLEARMRTRKQGVAHLNCHELFPQLVYCQRLRWHLLLALARLCSTLFRLARASVDALSCRLLLLYTTRTLHCITRVGDASRSLAGGRNQLVPDPSGST